MRRHGDGRSGARGGRGSDAMTPLSQPDLSPSQRATVRPLPFAPCCGYGRPQTRRRAVKRASDLGVQGRRPSASGAASRLATGAGPPETGSVRVLFFFETDPTLTQADGPFSVATMHRLAAFVLAVALLLAGASTAHAGLSTWSSLPGLDAGAGASWVRVYAAEGPPKVNVLYAGTEGDGVYKST